MRIYGVTGWKNSGKTTLVERLVAEIAGRGLSVSTIKHAHHAFDPDQPGRDSHRHRAAGASQVLVSSRKRWALMTENRGRPEAELGALIGQLAPVDLVLVEGYKQERHPKIETRRAVHNLPELLLGTLGRASIGVMIARGDLAVEIGGERLAEIQEEILWLCEAAHVPVIWATQVLETLTKKGVISRPELTDAAMAERADCVMLNKGPHVVRAVRTLADILSRMQDHQHKKSARLRALHW